MKRKNIFSDIVSIFLAGGVRVLKMYIYIYIWNHQWGRWVFISVSVEDQLCTTFPVRRARVGHGPAPPGVKAPLLTATPRRVLLLLLLHGWGEHGTGDTTCLVSLKLRVAELGWNSRRLCLSPCSRPQQGNSLRHDRRWPTVTVARPTSCAPGV